jgi:alpha-tubulin suppressor-like RCC1 family protein
MKVLLITSFLLLLTGCPWDKQAGSSDFGVVATEDCTPDEKSKEASLVDDTTEKCPKSEKAKAEEKAKIEEAAKVEEKAKSNSITSAATANVTAAATTTAEATVKYALVSFNVDSYAFSGGVFNTESEYTLTVSNKGDVAASDITYSAPATYYRVVSKTCGESLAANTDCTIKLGYKPILVGDSTATLVMGYNDGQEVKSKTFSMSGSALPAITSISPTASVATQVLTIVGQNFTSQTSIKIGNTECTKISAEATQITCSIPAGSGSQVVSASESLKESLYSSFTYLAPANLTVASSYAFGNVRKTNTGNGSLTLTNSGGFAAGSISLSGVSAPFTASSGCTTLAAGSTCTLTLGYTPTSIGANAATLTVSYHNGTANSSTSSSLSGTGIPKVIQVAAGNASSCLLYSEGNIKCVGLNRRLGNGTNDNIYISTWATATEVSGINNATQMSSYDGGSCARLSDGTVKCWGMFKKPNDSTFYTTPETISGITNAVNVSYNNTIISVRTSDGYIKTWGAGYLGNGTTNTSSTPVAASNIPSTYQVASHVTGGSFQVAVTTTGSVITWGAYFMAMLNPDNYTTPTIMAEFSSISQATAGIEYACVLNNSGNVYCWGRNEYGQRGIGYTTPTFAGLPTTPTQVTGLSNVQSLASGPYHSCAIKTDKTLLCWGYNQNGQVGNGASNTLVSTPTAANGLSNISQISVGVIHTMALTQTGDVYIWGDNSAYQLGLSDNTLRSTPVNINIQ